MLDVFSITLPIFILIAIGFLATRFGAMSPTDSRVLGGFVLRFGLPALIFKSLSQTPFATILNVPYLGVYTASSLLVFALAFALARKARPDDISAQAIQALGSAVSNSGFIGFPMALLFVGQAASVALALSMATENVVIIPLALTLAEFGCHRDQSPLALLGGILARLVRNPLIIGITLGVLASLFEVKLPGPIVKSVDMLAAASAATALFAVGGGLVGLEVAGVASDVARISFGKLIGLPLVVYFAQSAAPSLDPTLAKAMLILASAPMIGIYPLLARQYGQERVGSAALLTATAGAFVTMTLLLRFL